MRMLTVRLSCSIGEFEGGNETIEAVDQWFVDRGYEPPSDLDDGTGSNTARFEGRCREEDLPALQRLLRWLPWRSPGAVRLEAATGASRRVTDLPAPVGR